MNSKIGRTESQYAEQFQCDVRTIRRWKRAHAPLSDERAMRKWLTAQKQVPAGTRAWLNIMAAGDRSKVLSSALNSKLPRGAAAALKRLEDAEAAAYDSLQQALTTGDLVEIKLARDAWVKLGDSLRRYDLAVEATRRDAGKLIDREVVERQLNTLGRHLRLATRQLEQLCRYLTGLDEPHKVWKILSPWVDNFRAHTAGAVALVPGGLPQWMVDALLTGITCEDSAWSQKFTDYMKQLYSLALLSDEQREHAITKLPAA
jgi:phage terminase Nu1 subunit (DNA packaging protein)